MILAKNKPLTNLHNDTILKLHQRLPNLMPSFQLKSPNPKMKYLLFIETRKNICFLSKQVKNLLGSAIEQYLTLIGEHDRIKTAAPAPSMSETTLSRSPWRRHMNGLQVQTTHTLAQILAQTQIAKPHIFRAQREQ